MPVRYVRPRTDTQRDLLEQTMKHDASSRARARAHSLLLSDQGTAINDIATIYQVDRDTVSIWITKWEHQGEAGVHDRPRSGRPPKLTPAEKALPLASIKEAPRSLKQVGERRRTTTDQRISLSALKRLAKKARLRWKRVRTSLKSLRDPQAFARCKRELDALQSQEDPGKIALYSFDEAGFILDPVMPYAGQESGEGIELPAMQYGRINVLGFMNSKNDLHPDMFEPSVNPAVVIACFAACCETSEQKTIVVMDNASIHTSEEFDDHIAAWKKRGLLIKYLPAYSPEFNLIEILWRRITYSWVPFSAYQCLDALIEALGHILSHVGSEYQITFA
jgi:transposase